MGPSGLLEPLYCSFCFSVRLRMIQTAGFVVKLVRLCKYSKLLARKLWSIVRNENIWDPMSVRIGICTWRSLAHSWCL